MNYVCEDCGVIADAQGREQQEASLPVNRCGQLHNWQRLPLAQSKRANAAVAEFRKEDNTEEGIPNRDTTGASTAT